MVFRWHQEFGSHSLFQLEIHQKSHLISISWLLIHFLWAMLAVFPGCAPCRGMSGTCLGKWITSPKDEFWIEQAIALSNYHMQSYTTHWYMWKQNPKCWFLASLAVRDTCSYLLCMHDSHPIDSVTTTAKHPQHFITSITRQSSRLHYHSINVWIILTCIGSWEGKVWVSEDGSGDTRGEGTVFGGEVTSTAGEGVAGRAERRVTVGRRENGEG